MKQTTKRINPTISKGKYELTLAEFPLFLLAKGGKSKKESIQVIEYEDTIKGKDSQIIKREWRVYPHNVLGFGTASTFETLFDLFQIWKERNFDSQYITFKSIHNLLMKRGKNASVKEYERIIRDLDCLIGITIKAKNSFWDNEAKAYIDKTFHLFESLDLYKDKPNGQAVLPLSNIKASDVLYGSILKNSLLTTNFDTILFHKLTPVEQRLALYLSKMFRSQAIHKRELLELGRQIPLQVKQKKLIKQRLKIASEGLIAKNFELLKNLLTKKPNSSFSNATVCHPKNNLNCLVRPRPNPLKLKQQSIF